MREMKNSFCRKVGHTHIFHQLLSLNILVSIVKGILGFVIVFRGTAAI